MYRLRVAVACWLVDTFYRPNTDMSKDRPYIYGLADRICPGGIPDTW